jgi:hypothetical protein
MTNTFYNSPYDVREIEAKILAEKFRIVFILEER